MTIVSRGPKPVPLLRALDVPVAVVVPEPNTWKEIVDAVAVPAGAADRRAGIRTPEPRDDAALEKLGRAR